MGLKTKTKTVSTNKDWTIRSLESFCAFITKGATPTTYGFSWVNSGVLFLRSECVSDVGLNLSQSMYISPEANAVMRRSEIEDGDMLITITGNVGRVVYYGGGLPTANINQHIARIRIVDPEVDSQYVFQYLCQPEIRKYYGSIVTGQAYPQISLPQVRHTMIPMPSLSEQRAIAEALSDIDALIRSLDELIAKKRNIKQAAMQQLLTGKRRLPGFSGEWKNVRIGDVADPNRRWSFTGGPFGSNLKSSDYTDDGVRIIQLQNIGDGEFKDGYEIYTSVTKADELLDCNIYPGDLILSKMGDPVARACIIPTNHNRYVMCSDGIRLAIDASLFNTNFVLNQINANDFRNRAANSGTGSTRKRIGLTDLRDLELSCPPLPEQIAIAEVLTDMETEISVLAARREKTRLLKQGMMQELLTGRIRVI